MKFFKENFNNKTEKEKSWEEISSRVNLIVDKIGKGIDSKIKETVVAFQANGFLTDGSCEGHLDHGLLYPWIDVVYYDINNEEFKKQFPNYHADIEILKNKKYKDIEKIKTKDIALYNRVKSFSEFSKTKKAEIENKIFKILNEYYSSHKPMSEDGKLTLHESSDGFRLERSASKGLGLDNWKKYDEKMSQLNTEEKEKYLKDNQIEMKIFTQFLKDKFFNGK